MAKGLQCPACGHKHRLDALPSTATFRCAGCGQLLRNPARPSASPQAPSRRGTAGAPARTDRGADRTAVMVAPPIAPPGVAPVEVPARAPAPPAPPEARPPRREPPGEAAPRMPLVLRLVVWIVAVPVGGAVALLAARLIGFVDGSRLIDMISGDGWGRFSRLWALVPVWALLTAGLVQVAEHLWNRRRARRTGIGPAGGTRPA